MPLWVPSAFNYVDQIDRGLFRSCFDSSSRGNTDSLVTWPMPMRFENSLECSAKSTPFLNCRYPTGVRVAGVDTAGRRGWASGTGCRCRLCSAELSKLTSMKRQASWDDLQPLSFEPTTQIYFRNKFGTYQRV